MSDYSIYRRLTLRRGDGAVYLDRWGLGLKHVGAILLHRMDAPDPGEELHDHPWWFVTIPLLGGYVERRARNRDIAASDFACVTVERRRRFRPRVLRLDECHTIDRLTRRRVWTLVITGPVRGTWGFYLPDEGYVQHVEYESRPEGLRRQLHVQGGNAAGGH